MLGLPSYDISNPGNSLHFCLSGRLKQSWGQREPYSWRLTLMWLLPLPTVPLSLHQAPKLLYKHNCFPPTSTFFLATLHEIPCCAWSLANMPLWWQPANNNWQLSCHNHQHVQGFSRAVAGGERFGQFGSILSWTSRLALGTGLSLMVAFQPACASSFLLCGKQRRNCSMCRSSHRLPGLHRAAGNKI